MITTVPTRPGWPEIAFGSDVGRARELQEDSVYVWGPESLEQLTHKGYLCVVADGMGGHAAGEVASGYAIQRVFEDYYRDPSPDVYEPLKRAIQQVNDYIYHQAAQDPAKQGMGTTIVVAVVKERELFVANVGDSRAYLLRPGEQMQLLSEDHSWVWEQVQAGVLTPEQARVHPQRNVITRALGTGLTVEAYRTFGSLRPGDAVLLCSDGLNGPLADEEIQAILQPTLPAGESAARLIAAANERGGPDNISVVVMRLPGAPAPEPGASPAAAPAAVRTAPRKGRGATGRMLMGLTVFLAVAVLAVFATIMLAIALGWGANLPLRLPPASPLAAPTATLPPGMIPTPATALPDATLTPAGPVASVPASTPRVTSTPTVAAQPPVPLQTPGAPVATAPPRASLPYAAPKPGGPGKPDPAQPDVFQTDQYSLPEILFDWQGPPSLSPGEVYEVTLVWKEGGQGKAEAAYRGQATTWRMPKEPWFGRSRDDQHYGWFVTVRAADGQALSPPSPTQYFIWKDPLPGSPGTGPSGGPPRP